ncbi:MAG: hypothetical protein ACFFCD_15845 [Promethearchaeota archaeon]
MKKKALLLMTVLFVLLFVGIPDTNAATYTPNIYVSAKVFGQEIGGQATIDIERSQLSAIPVSLYIRNNYDRTIFLHSAKISISSGGIVYYETQQTFPPVHFMLPGESDSYSWTFNAYDFVNIIDDGKYDLLITVDYFDDHSTSYSEELCQTFRVYTQRDDGAIYSPNIYVSVKVFNQEIGGQAAIDIERSQLSAIPVSLYIKNNHDRPIFLHSANITVSSAGIVYYETQQTFFPASPGLLPGISGSYSWTFNAYDFASKIDDGKYDLLITVDYFDDQSSTYSGQLYQTFRIYTKTDGGGDGGGNGGGDGGGKGDGDGGGDGKISSCSLSFLDNYYSAKPGETFTLSGTISSNENGQLITIHFAGERYEVYTFNNGEFAVNLTAPNSYGSYKAEAKFAGDSKWNSAKATCYVLVVEEKTQLDFNLEGSLAKGEQIKIKVKLTKENGDPVKDEHINIYIYERKAIVKTNVFSKQSIVGTSGIDTRYWELIETLELTTDDEGNAVGEWTVTTDSDVGIVAEYAGKVEGEEGTNIGSSTVSYMEGEPLVVAFMPVSSLLIVGVMGVAAAAVIGLIVAFKTDLIGSKRKEYP